MTLIASACDPRGLGLQDIPTLASLDSLATAPSPRTRARSVQRHAASPTSITPCRHGGRRYLVQLDFEGVFADTPHQARASARAEVWFNQLASARHHDQHPAG
ncbi:MAG: hypothetical protein LC121_01595 [Anaerolineae bacterium]|nr:hypothetical protein [Anaerolineae bacterium]